MKKYWWLGLAVVVLGVCGALIFHAQSACPEYKGLRGKEISPAAFSHWIVPGDNVLFEIQKDHLYIQEAIGSTGIVLRNPYVTPSRFAFGLDMMSMTKSARLRLSVKDQQGSELYGFEMLQLNDGIAAAVRENGKTTAKARSEVILPDKYYAVMMEKSGQELSLAVNGKEILHRTAEGNYGSGYIELHIEGQPDHPAAFEFKNVILYQ